MKGLDRPKWNAASQALPNVQQIWWHHLFAQTDFPCRLLMLRIGHRCVHVSIRLPYLRRIYPDIYVRLSILFQMAFIGDSDIA
ncbi:MAG: hypothetical protein LBJ20_05560 [Candidatus Methanoplasma sp.]|jgi:hypothetical protein|nr:hypothetical protein [Candidatus Methanoplasma sp.]